MVYAYIRSCRFSWREQHIIVTTIAPRDTVARWPKICKLIQNGPSKYPLEDNFFGLRAPIFSQKCRKRVRTHFPIISSYLRGSLDRMPFFKLLIWSQVSVIFSNSLKNTKRNIKSFSLFYLICFSNWMRKPGETWQQGHGITRQQG